MFATLALDHFRNHRGFLLEDLPQHVVLCGDNGTGKTNVLEALSLFSAGRGLRNAALDDICPLDSPQEGFFVRASLRTDSAHPAASPTVTLATGFLPSHKRRRILVDEDEVSQSALREQVRLCWLVPQMGRFFTDGVGARRAWLDRLVARQDPQHEARLAKHAYLVKERLSVLLGYGQESSQRHSQEYSRENSWLEVLEQRLAEQAVALTALRADTLARLNALFKGDDFFAELTRLHLASDSKIDHDLQSVDALQAEQRLVGRLRSSRDKDKQDHRSSEGAHRARLTIKNISMRRKGTLAEGVRAELCSCGEQKLMLLSLLVAEALLLMGTAAQSSPPVLLLDDFPAHLDKQAQRRALHVLANLGSQCFYSANEPFTDSLGVLHQGVLHQGVLHQGVSQQGVSHQGVSQQGVSHQDAFSCAVFLLESNTVQRKAHNSLVYPRVA